MKLVIFGVAYLIMVIVMLMGKKSNGNGWILISL